MHPSSWLARRHVLVSLLLLPNLLTLTFGALTGKNMRIQPLGDSITFGYLSTDGNGYRNDLLQRLIRPITPATMNSAAKPANNVLYVGSVQSGNMTNNNNEGHSGAIISQIATYANLSLPERPNIVLLHAGTNDMTFNVFPTTAPTRISNLLDQIHAQCPDALILLAKILNAANTDTESRLKVFNSAIPGVVEEKVRAGMKVQLVDMTGIPLTELNDGLHPTDQGYNDMSAIWYQGLVEADGKGWIGEPVETTVTSAIRNDPATATIKLITSVLPSTQATSGVERLKAPMGWGVVGGLVLGGLI